MKYGKLLQLLLDDLPPEYRDKFLSYKQLKRRIKQFLDRNSLPDAAFQPAALVADRDGAELATLEEDVTRESVQWPPVACAHILGPPKRAKDLEGMPILAAGEDIEVGVEGSEIAGAGAKRKRVQGLEGMDGEKEVESVSGRGLRAERTHPPPLSAPEDKELTTEEEEFIRLLNVELEKFNAFFTEKEEDYVIRLQDVKHRLDLLQKQSRAHAQEFGWNEEFLKIRTDIVTFHGEMVLMESYSALNYTGLVKILKKHDKRTGAVLRLPFIRKVLLQPFFATELLSKLVQECDNLLSFFPPSPADESIDIEGDGSGEEAPKELHDASFSTGGDVQVIYKSMVAALRTLQEIRKGSSTVSAQSLPPCNLFEKEETFGVVVNEKSTPAVAVTEGD